MYTKVFRSIFDGSLYGHFESTVTFLAFLILANKEGEVDQTAEKIAANTGFPLDLIQKGIRDLTSPDAQSRTPDEEGRRLVLLDSHRDWGWRIVNFEKYNSIRNQQERAEYFRQYRKRKRNVLRVTDATKGNQKQPPKTPSYSYSDTDSRKEEEAAALEKKDYPKDMDVMAEDGAYLSWCAENYVDPTPSRWRNWVLRATESGRYAKAPSRPPTKEEILAVRREIIAKQEAENQHP